MRTLTPIETQALHVAAKAINCDPRDLRGLIEFESAWDPYARNPVSGARGLIQFMTSTARGLGYDSADQVVVLHPTRESQLLGPVIRHFRSVGAAHPTFQALCMAVFYPAFRSVPEATEFPERVRAQNPGIRTVRDYLDKVRRRIA